MLLDQAVVTGHRRQTGLGAELALVISKGGVGVVIQPPHQAWD